MQICRHRAEAALKIHLGRDVSLKESTSLCTALMNPEASASIEYCLGDNLQMTLQMATMVYRGLAPQECPATECLYSAELPTVRHNRVES